MLLLIFVSLIQRGEQAAQADIDSARFVISSIFSWV